MPSTEFKDAIGVALSHGEPDDVIEGVKSAVISELESLDPSVKIEKTDHFNHSFAPDIVLTWKDGARKAEQRDLYLRFSLRSSRAARDFELLGKNGPIFLSLDSENDDDRVSAAIAQDLVKEAPESLCTNAPALDRIGSDSESVQGLETVSPASSPLLNLFRRNVVRGGRGLIVGGTADRLDEAVTAESDSDISYVDKFEAVVAGVFSESASLRLRRAAELIRIALSGDTNRLDRDEESGRLSQVLAGGKLDDSELRVLLPFLLERAQAIRDPRFWHYVGEMMSLSQLEAMAPLVSKFNLSPLVKANIRQWTAARSMMSFNPDAVDAEERIQASWRIDAGVLCAFAGIWKVHFSSDNRRGGRTRTDSLLGNWTDLASKLDGFRLAAVDLQGIDRRVTVSAENESNVLADALAVQNNIADNFFVRSLSIRSSVDDSSPITVDFPTMSAAGSQVPLTDLVKASFGLLGYRYPILDDESSYLVSEGNEAGS